MTTYIHTTCPQCNGLGEGPPLSNDPEDDRAPEPCQRCHGHGYIAADPVLTACDAVYAFAAWLTCRPGLLKVGDTHDASPMAELAEAWTKANGIPEVSEAYPKNFTHPPYPPCSDSFTCPDCGSEVTRKVSGTVVIDSNSDAP